MSSQQPPKPPPQRPPGSIDFEITEFEDARHVLDDLPPGVVEAKHLQPGYWEQQRRKPVPTDRALTGAAMDWVIKLPPALRPHATCEHFPRVVNAIASCWADNSYSVQVLDHMINDYRGGRRGFPAVVQQELAALLSYQNSRS
jgi:hypothetical protein